MVNMNPIFTDKDRQLIHKKIDMLLDECIKAAPDNFFTTEMDLEIRNYSRDMSNDDIEHCTSLSVIFGGYIEEQEGHRIFYMDECDTHYDLVNNETGEVLESGDIVLPREE